MVRTIKLPYTTSAEAAALIAEWRKAQSVVIRTAYNRVRDGWSDKNILDALRQMPQGRLDSWLTLSAIKRARAIHKAHPDKPVIFGGKRNLRLRSEKKITKEQWRQRRLLPLYFEGHAKSHGEQGGNHRFVLDIEHNTVRFYPRRGTERNLSIKLGQSNYRDLLQALQNRCTDLRDTPFTVSLTEKDIAISWDEKPQAAAHPLNGNRAIALDLNPNRIGAAVIEKDGRLLHWQVFEYTDLNQKLGKASDSPEVQHQNHKRLYELSLIGKEIVALALHYQCATVTTEFLNITTQDHGKGRSFNRAVNNQWTRRGLLLPLLRRLEAAGIRHREINPAYSSKIGNLLWGWPLSIPDPACAAVEIGRRNFNGDPKRSRRQNGGNPRKEERQTKAAQAAEVRQDWKKVWEDLKPKAGDTTRCTIRALKAHSPESCPRPGPFQSVHSRVTRLKPTRLAPNLPIRMPQHL